MCDKFAKGHISLFGVMLCCFNNLFEHSRYGIKNVYFAFFLPNHYDLAQQCSLQNRTFFSPDATWVSYSIYIEDKASLFNSHCLCFVLIFISSTGRNTISPMKFYFFLMDLKQTQLSLFSYHGLHEARLSKFLNKCTRARSEQKLHSASSATCMIYK